ncbi:unnamed protein product [Triticum turgidum subsp. durum]|uniref:Ribulose bisphosphate carboxylase/oxygenase activase AAA helical domain-containing protein n=1 Tax=Triticum turgidum subsp. durum TaxID=4567 RepID=A0A9R0T4T3_TRITD|nr:unnamed protein product [Triticum turgidum subsp. durum]
MAAAFSSTVGAPASTPTNFLGKKLKKQVTSAVNYHGKSSKANRFTVMAAENLDEKRNTDKWKGLAYDISDDQQDITRGKGIVDSLFQAPTGDGTHEAVLSSYEYVSQGLKKYDFDNTMGGFYIAPAFMDKLVVHLSKNFMTLPNIKIPLILGIWGGKGQGKSFQCELVFAKMGINDLDAGAGRMGGTTQYTVNNQMVNATLMNIADAPTNVQLPGMYNKEENPRVPIVVTGNDFSTLYAPLIRDGRMEKFYWAPTRDDRIGVCKGIFQTDNVSDESVVKIVDTFPGQSIDFFGALRARVYDDEVRKWVTSTGIENIGKRLVNSRDGPVTFEQPKMTVEKLLEYGHMLVQEQDNVKRVQLADTYMSQAALGDANQDAMKTGSFYGKGAQQGTLPVPAGCTDQTAKNFDPTARSDDGSCLYTF